MAAPNTPPAPPASTPVTSLPTDTLPSADAISRALSLALYPSAPGTSSSSHRPSSHSKRASVAGPIPGAEIQPAQPILGATTMEPPIGTANNGAGVAPAVPKAAAETTLSALTTSSPIVLTVFIRHFYCTSCHNFLEAMAATQELSQAALAARGVKLVIVGCGQPEVIEEYRKSLASAMGRRGANGNPQPTKTVQGEQNGAGVAAETPQAATKASSTGPEWEFYTDPEGAVYDSLGMTRTMSLGKKPGYIRDGMLAGIIKGVIASLKGGVTKGGNPTRNGGEFLWVNGNLVYAHFMQNTRDHLEVGQVLKLLDEHTVHTQQQQGESVIAHEQIVPEGQTVGVVAEGV
ncbi:hypothetical protein FPQ18DRAFT_332604 [Pyronema domesticum]|nr:hypothetical protein FPQ18DRAFT_332604 [Pyronema domesticum]